VSRKKTGLSILDDTLPSGYRVKKVGRGEYEIWTRYSFEYVCLLAYKRGKWGATHNMHCEHPTFDIPIEAINDYRTKR